MGRPPEPLEKLTPPNFKLRTAGLRNAILKFFSLPENKSMDLTRGMSKILRQIVLNPDSEYVYHICNYPKKLYQLKVSRSQNKFMRSSFLPKYERNILKISALASKERSKKNKALYYTSDGLLNIIGILKFLMQPVFRG